MSNILPTTPDQNIKDLKNTINWFSNKWNQFINTKYGKKIDEFFNGKSELLKNLKMQILWNNLNLKNGWYFKITAPEEEIILNKDLKLLSEIFPKYIVSKNSFLKYIGIIEENIQSLEKSGKIKIEDISWKDIPNETENTVPTYLISGNPYEGKIYN